MALQPTTTWLMTALQNRKIAQKLPKLAYGGGNAPLLKVAGIVPPMVYGRSHRRYGP
jgi:hypothetical protein